MKSQPREKVNRRVKEGARQRGESKEETDGAKGKRRGRLKNTWGKAINVISKVAY